MTDGVAAQVVQQLRLDRPAASAGLRRAGKLEMGDEFVVLIDEDVSQDELGQGEQQLAPPLDTGSAPPLDTGSLVHAQGLGRTVGLRRERLVARRRRRTHGRCRGP